MRRGVRIMALALGLLVVLLVTYYVGQRLSAAYRTGLTACVEDAGTGGGLGLVRFAERLGYDVLPMPEPVWHGLAGLARSQGVCLITAGRDAWEPPDPHRAEAAWSKLRAWVARGNTLICLTSSADGVPPFLFDRPREEPRVDGPSSLFGLVELPGDSEDEPGTTVVQTPYGPLRVRADGPRLTGGLERAERFGDQRGAVLVQAEVGAGRVFVLFDDFAFVNAGLDCADNALVLGGILRQAAPSGQVVVDEYRHGHGRAESFLTFALSLPGAWSFAALAAGLTLFWLWAGNWRFGPPEPYEKPERRTAMEYIDSVADLYRRAHAAPLAVAAVAGRLRFLGHQRGEVGRDIAEALAEADRYVQRAPRPAHPTTACQLVREMIQLRKKRYGY